MCVSSRQVQVGDIVYVSENEECPADLVLLKACAQHDPHDLQDLLLLQDQRQQSVDGGDDSGEGTQVDERHKLGTTCFIQTSNIDGETNLKER